MFTFLYLVCLQAGLGCKHKLWTYHFPLLKTVFRLRVCGWLGWYNDNDKIIFQDSKIR